MRLPLKDRHILEQIIFPFISSNQAYQNILFVGCHWYTKSYPSFFPNKNFLTIDPLPKRKKYGSKNHFIGKIEDGDQFFESNSIDVIICNGVIGYGLNEIKNAEKAFSVCHRILRSDGILIIGWNDKKNRKPFELSEVKSLKSFSPLVFPPLETNLFRVKSITGHVYQFFTKKENS